jgi:type II secretory pathway component PulJ
MKRRAGFVLLEAMIAVAIFAIGVITLGRCVSNCVAAERFKVEDARARRVLENRMAEIEAESVSVGNPSEEKLKAPFEGMTLKQRRVELKKKNEKKADMTGLYAVTLEVTWLSDREPQSKQLTFYVHPRKP